MPVCLFVCLYVFLFVCLSDFTLCLLICLSVCLSVYLPSCLSACLLICLSGFLYVCQSSSCLSVCLLICLSILFVCHPICLSVSFWKVLHSRVGSALPANLRQGWKILPGTNTLDYYENSWITDKRNFITLAPCSRYNTQKKLFYLQIGEEVVWPHWIEVFTEVSHLLLTFNCSVNFYIYLVSSQNQGQTFADKTKPVACIGKIFWRSLVTIVNDACTINGLHLSLSLCFSLS